MTVLFSAMTTRRGGLVAMAVAVALACSSRAASAQAAPGSRMLVLPFTVVTDGTAPGGAAAAFWLSEASSILLSEQVELRGGGTISRAERVAALDRLQLRTSPALTRAAMIRLGELLGASEVVSGEIFYGDVLVVHARMVALDEGRIWPDVVDQAPVSDLFTLLSRLTGRLIATTGRLPSVQSPGKSAAAPLTLEAFENYAKGLVAGTPAAQQRFLELALKSAPKEPRVLTALWSVYSVQGAYEKALGVASDVPAESPMSRKAQFLAALSFIDLRRLDGAIKALTVLESESPSPVLENALGVVRLRRGGSTGAVEAAPFFSRAVAAEPGNADYLFNLGYAYALSGNSELALSTLREVVRHDAASGDAHIVMSAVLAGSGKGMEAGRELDLAKLLGTRLDAAAVTIGDRVPAGLEHLPVDLDTPSAARIDLARSAPAAREQQETAAFYLEQGRRLIASERDRDAIDQLRRSVYLSPYEDEPHLLLGRLYARGGRLSEAIDEFKIAIWCRETVEARVALGSAYLQAGDRDAARREATRALVLAPDSSEARALLSRIGGAARVLISGHTDV